MEHKARVGSVLSSKVNDPIEFSPWAYPDEDATVLCIKC